MIRKIFSLRFMILPLFILFNVKIGVSQNWPRLPSDSEINQAVEDYFDNPNADIRIGTEHYIIKHYNKKQAEEGFYGRVATSRVILIANQKLKQYGQEQNYLTSPYLDYNLNTKKWEFGSSNSYLLQGTKYYLKSDYKSAKEVYDAYVFAIQSKSEWEFGFAPPQTERETGNDSEPIQNNNNQPPPPPPPDDDIPWDYVIGAAAGLGFIEAIRRLRKKLKENKAKEKSRKKEKDKKDEEVGYLLQLSTEQVDFTKANPQELSIRVWKVTEKDKKQIPASIQIQNIESALSIKPNQGTTPMDCVLELKGEPARSNFDITVYANAEGHAYQKKVNITAGGQKRIVFETAPDNKRSLRPDIDQLITLYAQFLDESGKKDDELTKKIVFKPIGEWVDISEPTWDEGWAAINVGASNPQPTSISSHPPKEVAVDMELELLDENGDVEDTFKERLVLQLLDCMLESEIYHCTFPAIEEKTEIKFKVWVKPSNKDEKWNFNGLYRIGVDTEDDPLTEIHFKKLEENKREVRLVGPIMLPPKGERSISKKLVISAAQKDEEPIEAHITVSVSKAGLYIEDGVNKQNELKLLADKPQEKNIDFGLFKYDKKTKQVAVDKVNLGKLSFELLNTDQTSKNIVSVLQPEFSFDQLVTNIPYGRYILKTKEEIPGSGNTYDIKYKVTAPIKLDEKEEEFTQELILKVQTKNIGRKMKSWEQAYKECQYMIENYVPTSEAKQKLTQILEKRKHFLDVEGLEALRNKIGHIAADLILAEGAEGYKEVDKWATRIETTLEWTQWAGDLCFAALLSFYVKNRALSFAAGIIKAKMIEAINFRIYEKDNNTGWDPFFDRQMDGILPLFTSTAKGRLLNIENIEAVVGKNKAICWAVYISCQFLVHLYQTESMIQAAKNTGREIRDELLVQFLGKQLNKRVGAYDQVKKQPSKRVQEKLDELESEIKTNRIGGKFMDKKRVLEIMEDPALVRTIKNHGSKTLKKAFDGPRQKIYREHDRRLINEIARELKTDPKNLEVDDFRTPGDTSDNLNTDRDYRVVRKVKLKNGKEAKIEVSRKVFESKSQRIFGELTDKPPHIPDAEWAERKQQLATDFTCEEANIDYSDQAVDPDTGERIQVESNVVKVKKGKSTLKNADSMGKMYKAKVKNAGERPEKYAQAQKATKTIKKIKHGYGTKHKVKPTSKKLQKAMEIIEEQPTDIDMTPERMAETHKRLQNLGYKNGLEDVMEDIHQEFKDLKDVPKKNVLFWEFNWFN